VLDVIRSDIGHHETASLPHLHAERSAEITPDRNTGVLAGA
jgi:hypothetical protein